MHVWWCQRELSNRHALRYKKWIINNRYLYDLHERERDRYKHCLGCNQVKCVWIWYMVLTYLFIPDHLRVRLGPTHAPYHYSDTAIERSINSGQLRVKTWEHMQCPSGCIGFGSRRVYSSDGSNGVFSCRFRFYEKSVFRQLKELVPEFQISNRIKSNGTSELH